MESNHQRPNIKKVTSSILIRNFFAYTLLLTLIYFVLPYSFFRLIIFLIFMMHFVILIFFLRKISNKLLTNKGCVAYTMISSGTCSFILCCLWLYSFLSFLSPIFTAVCILIFSLLTLLVSYISARQLIFSENPLLAAKIAIHRLLWIVCAESIVVFIIVFFFSNVKPNGLMLCLNIISFLGYVFMLYAAIDIIVNWTATVKK